MTAPLRLVPKQPSLLCEPQRIQLGKPDAPNRQEASTPLWLPALFLAVAIVIVGFVGGLLTWAARTYVEVTPEPAGYGLPWPPERERPRTPKP